jgi:phospholipase D-like protein
VASVTKSKGKLSVKAYAGDAKTLLAFNLDKTSAKNLAGFTIQCQPDGLPAYYIQNELQFKSPGDHAQDAKEPPNSSINAPIHKFRWLHVPGAVHQGIQPFLGKYTYTITPRYFDDKASLKPMDPSSSVAVIINVVPFRKNGFELGFTRGFVQSQAFVHHFGRNAGIQPKNKDLLFDTSQESGVNAAGTKFTFADEYLWLGFTARQKIFGILNDVLADKSLHLDMFAYDLNEPDILKLLLKLAGKGQVRVILDNATLHHNTKSPKPEDQFEKLFMKAKKGQAAILRGKFNRFAHDKVLIVSRRGKAQKVLTGSTNFSVTGMYVNSNHVLVFNDPKVADIYSQVFETAWQDKVSGSAFKKSSLAAKNFPFSSQATPKTEVSFAPHQPPFALTLLKDLTKRIAQEKSQGKSTGSVLFAVMQLDKGTGPVLPALTKLHAKQTIFSYGISDTTKGIYLYAPGKKTGVLVTGKPGSSQLPPPFDQVPGIGLGHQIHHKFVVCGFNRPDAVVYCGSSNLAEGGEESNGDNLLAVHDSDVATAFAIEALALVDHFNFLDKYSKAPKAKKGKPPAVKQQAAAAAGWFLSTSDKWVAPYFDPKDLHGMDREIFG